MVSGSPAAVRSMESLTDLGAFQNSYRRLTVWSTPSRQRDVFDRHSGIVAH